MNALSFVERADLLIVPRRYSKGHLVLALTFLVGGCIQGHAQVNPILQNLLFTVTGQVSFSNGKPVGRAVVRLTTRGGASFEKITNDQGRFEFTDVTPGGFSLMARTMTEPRMQSEVIQTDTSRTLTGFLYVNLTLGESTEKGNSAKPGVITAAVADQKVPKEARKAFILGLKLKKENPDQAERNLSRAIELFPEYFQALTERGDLYISQLKLETAVADFDRALKINPRYGPALRGAGYCKLNKKEFQKAIDYFQQSILAEPDNAATYLLLGISNLEIDQRDAAKKALQEALTLGATRAHIYLGNLYARQQLFQQAADELHAYLEAEPAVSDAASLKATEAQWRARVTP